MKSFLLIALMTLSSGYIFANRNQLEDLWDISIKNNPAILAQAHKVKAMKKLVMAKRFPPDPQLKFNLMNQPVDSSVQSPMSSFQIMLSQNIPFPTKLYLRSSIQFHIYEIEQARLALMISDLKRDISLTFVEIIKLHRLLQVENEKLSKIQLIKSIALSKYELGKGLQQDLLKISVTELQTKKKIISLKSGLTSKHYELDYLLGIKDIPVDFQTESLIIQDFDKQVLIKKVRENYPLLHMKKKMIEKSQAELALVRWDYLPDLGLTLAYNMRDDSLADGGVDQYTVGVNVSLPLYSLFKQLPIDQAQVLNLKSSQQELQDAYNKTDELLSIHLDMLRQDKDIVDLYEKNIINESEQSLDVSVSSYQVDKVDFLNVLNSMLSLYQHQEDYYEYRASLHSHQIWLEYLQRPQTESGVENE